MIELLLLSIAVWRLSHAISKDDGPLNIFLRFRAFAAANQRREGGVFDTVSCVGCTSMWVALVFSLCFADNPVSWIIYTLVLSGVAMLIERAYASLNWSK
jgi:hypothetical protein